jgi:lipid-A-disaccharide synthase
LIPRAVSKRIYFVAGEASGDTHGAALMTSLREIEPGVELLGRGGPRMKALAGDQFTDWSDKSAVLGLWEVLKQYGYFRQQFAATLAQIREQRPDAVLLIDYPGFNLRLARALRAQLPTLKIIYYISPQVWAWNRRRIPQMARYLDLMLCIFPFEAELYNKSGLRTVFVGHPMLETLNGRRITGTRDPNLIGLFPGSRMREIRKILPTMIGAAERISATRPDTRFEVAAASARLADEINTLVRSSRLSADAVHVTIGEASAAMQRAQAGIVASGTATLEAAFFRMPFVLVYRVAWLTYIAAKIVVRIKHVGMPNVLAGREIVPEFIQHRAKPAAVAAALSRLLHEGPARQQMTAEFDSVIAQLGEGAASAQAAKVVFSALES